MALLQLVATRILSSVLTLFLVSAIIFAAVEVLPGDVASRILGREAPEAAKQRLREELNLHAPVLERYADWAGGALRGDFGTSISARQPVDDVLWPRLANTLALAGLAFLFYVPLSILPAILQSRRPDGRLDRLISGLTILILSMPEFLLATLLLFAFAVALPVFPPMAQVQTAADPIEFIWMILLPAIALALLMATYGVRLLRESLIELMGSDFVRMARLKGLSPRRVLWRHALPNAVVPWLNATALNVAFMIGGVVVVERVFAFPGFGSILVDALQLRDLPLIEAGVLVAAALFILLNLLADLVAMVLNPRLRG
jgi:peptide/nickel transport system permease protein